MDTPYTREPEVQTMAAPEQVSPDATLAASRINESGWISGTVYNRVAQLAVYLAVLLLPLWYLPVTSSVLNLNKQMLLVVLAAVALVVWLLGIVVSGTMTLRTSALDKGILALVVGTGAAAIAAISPMKSIFGLSVSLGDAFITMVSLAILYWIALNVFHDHGRMLRRILMLSGAVALILGILQMLTVYILPGGFTSSRAFNTVGSINTLGVFAAVLLPLFAKATGRLWGIVGTIISWIGVVAALVILAILNWWILWAIALAGMLAMIGFDSLNAAQMAGDYATGSRRKRFAMSRFIVPMAVIVLGAFLLLVNFNLTAVKSQFPVEISPSFGMSWGIAQGVLGEDLLFGYGPEHFSVAFDQFGAGRLANTQLANLRFFDGTSQLFTMLVSGGAIMMLALVVLLWSLVQVAARLGGALATRMGRQDGGSEASEASGVLSATVALTVGLFLYPFNVVLMGLWFFLLALSALVVTGDRVTSVDIEQRPMFSLSASLGFIVALIVALAGVYFVTVAYLGDVAYAKIAQRETPEEALNDLARAINLNAKNDRYYRDASQLTLQVLRTEINAEPVADDGQRAARIQNLIASSVQLAQRATELAPQEQLNWANLAAVYQSLTGMVQNVEELAEESYAKASELRPGDPSFDNRAGSMWLARADLIRQVAQGSTGENLEALRTQATESLDRAEAAFTRALEKAPSYGLAIYNRAAVYDRQNKVPEAIAELEKIIPANANQPTLMFELGILYLRDGQNDNALAAMQRAVILSPTYANARWYLALLLEERGEIDAALLNLQEIQKTNEDNEVLQAKITQLEAGEQLIPPEEVVDQEPLDAEVETPEPIAPEGQ